MSYLDSHQHRRITELQAENAQLKKIKAREDLHAQKLLALLIQIRPFVRDSTLLDELDSQIRYLETPARIKEAEEKARRTHGVQGQICVSCLKSAIGGLCRECK